MPDVIGYGWPVLMETYFNVTLNDDQVRVWWSEINHWFGGILDDEVCQAVRLGSCNPALRYRPTAKTLRIWIHQLRKQKRNAIQPRDDIGRDRLMEQCKREIENAKTDEEAWGWVCGGGLGRDCPREEKRDLVNVPMCKELHAFLLTVRPDFKKPRMPSWEEVVGEVVVKETGDVPF